jgi:hypothetical protein
MPQSAQMVYRMPGNVVLAVRQTPSMQSVPGNRDARSENAALFQRLRQLLYVLRTERRVSAHVLNDVARAVAGRRVVGMW